MKEEGNTWKFIGDAQKLDREIVARGGKDREGFGIERLFISRGVGR